MHVPTYDEYCAYTASKGFQPLGKKAFKKLAAAGFNPISNTFGIAVDGFNDDAIASPTEEYPILSGIERVEPLQYRFDGFDLRSGNKSAGFVVTFPTRTMARLRNAQVTPEREAVLHQLTQERLMSSGILPKRLIAECGVVLLANSACPRGFVADPVFGASVSADPEELQRLAQPSGATHIGPELRYTPHNTDSAAQALALSVLVITWAEWANAELVRSRPFP